LVYLLDGSLNLLELLPVILSVALRTILTANEKLNEMIRCYSRISRFPSTYQDVLKIDKPIRWLLADVKDQYISIYRKNIEHKILDVDITGCFPTVCKYLFSEENPEFVSKIEALDVKLERNILISNTLKGTNYLKILNIISKMVILGFIFDRQDSDKVSLLEFEKDGCLIFSSDTSYSNCIENLEFDSPFLDFVQKNQFKFHTKEYDYYIRCNNTSWFWSDRDSSLKIKGIYKHTPPKIIEFYRDLFSGKKTNLQDLLKFYQKERFKLIQKNHLDEILQDYYFCDQNKRILTPAGKYELYTFRSIIDPSVYVKTFVNPIWLFNRRNLVGIN